MADDAILIRDPEVVRNIQRLAQRVGKPEVEAVAEAVREKLSEPAAPDETEVAERRQRVAAALAKWDALPHQGEPLTDADLYGEDGLPR